MKHLITAAILMAAGHSLASTPALYECVYNYRADNKNPEKPASEEINCILQIGDDQSLFSDYATFRFDSICAVPGVSNDQKIEYKDAILKAVDFFDQTILNDPAKGTLKVYSAMSPERYVYTQKLPLVDWQLSEATDTICGYACHKATGNYGGRDWTVWYADEIPVPFGPWKMTGLPGLVLKATDAEGYHDFEAISFRNASTEFSEPKVPNVISIDAEKFIARKNMFDRNPMGTIQRESISSVEVLTNGSVFVNGVRLPKRISGYQPLEYTPVELQFGLPKDTPKQRNQEEIKIIGVGVSAKK